MGNHDDNERELVHRVTELGGLTSRDAVRAIEATLSGLNAILPERQAAAVERALGEKWSFRCVHDGDGQAAAALYKKIATVEGVSLGHAVEHAQAVCRAIGEVIDREQRDALVRSLPKDLAVLFAPARGPSLEMEKLERKSHDGHPTDGHTLATGRPGSQSPMSEARPRWTRE